MTAAVAGGSQPGLTFDPEAHEYHLDGQRLMSVTDVLRSVQLIDDSWFDEEARVRGRYVHKAIAYEERGGLDESSVDERLAGYLAAYRAFVREVEPGACLLVEEPLAHPIHRYAGTVDQVRPIAGKLAVLEHKTGGPARWHALQTAAYAALAEVKLSPAHPLRRYVLYLRPDGTYRLVEQSSRDDWKLFLAALALAAFKASDV